MRLALKASDESGMMIVQVVIISAVLLGVLLAGFQAVQSTIKVANTTASSAAFKDLVLAIQQSLASTTNCATRITLNGAMVRGKTLSAITNVNGVEATVMAPLGNGGALSALAVKEVSATTKRAAEFKITEVKIRNIKPRSWGVAGIGFPGKGAAVGIGKVEAELSIVAERRSNFLGAKTLRAQVPLLFGVNVSNSTVSFCTVQSSYSTELGPPDNRLPSNLFVVAPGWVRKSALECIDRGGAVILEKTDPTWSVCRLRTSSFLACKAGEANKNFPGWYCMHTLIIEDANTGAGYSDAY